MMPTSTNPRHPRRGRGASSAAAVLLSLTLLLAAASLASARPLVLEEEKAKGKDKEEDEAPPLDKEDTPTLRATDAATDAAATPPAFVEWPEWSDGLWLGRVIKADPTAHGDEDITSAQTMHMVPDRTVAGLALLALSTLFCSSQNTVHLSMTTAGMMVLVSCNQSDTRV
jgi:hypothetical protein